MSLVRYESRDHVATITMDRASAHNALNNALCDELREAWLRFHESDDRVAVLASAEEKYFCVGADVKDLPVNMWHAVPGLGVELDKPVIAATWGWVVGGGFVLVQMAVLCIASETTRFIYPEVKVGTTASRLCHPGCAEGLAYWDSTTYGGEDLGLPAGGGPGPKTSGSRFNAQGAAGD